MLILEPDVAWNLALATITTSSLTVTWDAPIGGVTSYSVEIDTVPSRKTIYSSAERTATVDGLTAGTQYTVVVISVSGEQHSEPLYGTFFTSKFADLHLFRSDITREVKTVSV